MADTDAYDEILLAIKIFHWKMSLASYLKVK
jgi:hypothetical protein